MIGYFEYKYKFFNKTKLTINSILYLLAVYVFCLNTSNADIRPSNEDSGLAVVIENNSNYNNANYPFGISNLIITAFENYCYHYLYNNEVKFQVFTTNNISKTDSLISSLSHKYFTKIFFMKVRDLYFTTNNIVTDSHRRKYFRHINNNLDLVIHYQEYNYKNGDWTGGDKQLLKERCKKNWYNSEIMSMRGNENIVGRAEPYEFVIQRAVDRLLSNIKLPERKPNISKNMIPLNIYLGNDLDSSIRIRNENYYKQIINYASNQFYNQFSFGLDLKGIERIDSLIDDESFYNSQLNSNYHFFIDTIKTFIFSQFDFWEYYNSSRITEIGHSRLGNRVIRIKLFPEREQSGYDWNNYFNSLTLLHEIGHSFGAIHASDINSIMNYSYSWVGPKSYDPVNAKIIKASLQGKIHPLDAAKYLAFISQTLQNTDYGLIDFPSFFYDFLRLENNKKYFAKLKGAIGYRPYLLAIDGYAMLKEGEYEKAANLFREAIRYEPEQASLQYYLSLVTKGKESFQARREALKRGYVDAVE